MSLFRTYKIRLYPNQKQQEFLNKTFGCCRFIWNKMLEERINVFQRLQHNRNELYSYVYTSERKFKSEYEFLREIDSIALQSSRKNPI